MDKLDMQTKNIADENYKALAKLFPNALTEKIVGYDENGKAIIDRAIDVDVLRQEISCSVVEGREERYQFTWPDKKKTVLLSNSPISKTLRPSYDESVNFDNTKNLYIEGDNLDVLKLLQETYLHCIDVIYIDPPYNTGNNLIYKNDFRQSTSEYLYNSGQYDEDRNMLVKNPIASGRFHTDWLNMIYSRLRLAKNLLSDEGILIFTIDDYEIQTVTMVLNEIFGEENRLATIVVKNNPSGRSTITGASISHEYALFYGANVNVKLSRLPRNDKQIARYKEEDNKGRFEWVNFRKHGGYKEDAPTMYYPIYIKKNGTNFRIPKLKWNDKKKEYEILDELKNDEFISWPIDENGRPRRWKWSLERVLKDTEDISVRMNKDKIPAVYIKARMKDEGMLPLTVWDDKKYSSTEYGTNMLIDIFGERVFDYPKSLYAVMDCLRIASPKKDALILDFFSGSATTAHAVMQLNVEDRGKRKFIMVQLPEVIENGSNSYNAGYATICDIGKERIRKSGEQISKEMGFLLEDIDVGFRVLKLDTTNMRDIYYNPKEVLQPLLFTSIDNIKEDRTPEDLLFQVMLDLGVLLSSKIEEKTIAGKKVFNVADGFLIACFDKDVTEETIKAVAQEKPYYAVFRDNCMANDSVATNFEQIFATYSPETIRKVL